MVRLSVTAEDLLGDRSTSTLVTVPELVVDTEAPLRPTQLLFERAPY